MHGEGSYAAATREEGTHRGPAAGAAGCVASGSGSRVSIVTMELQTLVTMELGTIILDKCRSGVGRQPPFCCARKFGIPRPGRAAAGEFVSWVRGNVVAGLARLPPGCSGCDRSARGVRRGCLCGHWPQEAPFRTKAVQPFERSQWEPLSGFRSREHTGRHPIGDYDVGEARSRYARLCKPV